MMQVQVIQVMKTIVFYLCTFYEIVEPSKRKRHQHSESLSEIKGHVHIIFRHQKTSHTS